MNTYNSNKESNEMLITISKIESYAQVERILNHNCDISETIRNLNEVGKKNKIQIKLDTVTLFLIPPKHDSSFICFSIL